MNDIPPIIMVILSLVAILLAVYCLWQVRSFNAMRKAFFAGKNAGDLEEVIKRLQTAMSLSREQQTSLEASLKNLSHNTSFAMQKLGLVRFNPFDDGGGNFSFSLALLDLHDTGVIITSMHGRQQNRIYTKTIQNGRCEIPLTEEEQQAINLADQPRSKST